MLTTSTNPWLSLRVSHSPYKTSSTKFGDVGNIISICSPTRSLQVIANAKASSKMNDMGISTNTSINQDEFTFRQDFSIKSYEIDADRALSIETLVNHLQETAINHAKSIGLRNDGFGWTPEMCKRNLIWVITRMQVQVDHYSTWEDVVQVRTSFNWLSKSGMRRNWLVHDNKAGKILAKASSVMVMMNKDTRKLCKFPDEVITEITPYFSKTPPTIDQDNKVTKLDDHTAQYICKGLHSKWSDLDINQHVNNVKYIDWILESIPRSIFESHKLSSMTIEYRRECGRDNVIQSLTSINSRVDDKGLLECQHLLRLDDGVEIVRGRTKWKPKHTISLGNGSRSYSQCLL